MMRVELNTTYDMSFHVASTSLQQCVLPLAEFKIALVLITVSEERVLKRVHFQPFKEFYF